VGGGAGTRAGEALLTVAEKPAFSFEASLENKMSMALPADVTALGNTLPLSDCSIVELAESPS
jgi:hypothetical protein